MDPRTPRTAGVVLVSHLAPLSSVAHRHLDLGLAGWLPRLVLAHALVGGALSAVADKEVWVARCATAAGAVLAWWGWRVVAGAGAKTAAVEADEEGFAEGGGRDMVAFGRRVDAEKGHAEDGSWGVMAGFAKNCLSV